MILSFTLDFDDDRAEVAIGLLAKFFRISLSNDALFMPLSKELSQIESYAKIQQLRCHDKFSLTITNHVKDDPLFLHFTLQPIIENAIYHGIKKQVGKGWIEVACERSGDNLVVTIKNSVDSVDSEKIKHLNHLFATSDNAQDYPGYGLFNVRQRLRINIATNASIAIANDATSVWITIVHPIITEGKTNEYINCR